MVPEEIQCNYSYITSDNGQLLETLKKHVEKQLNLSDYKHAT